jgi:hypothetical protein
MPEDIRAQLKDATADSSTASAETVETKPDVSAGTDAGTGSGSSTVSLEAFNEVLERLKSTNAQLESMKGGMAFVEKVKQVLTDDKPVQSPRDQMIRDELYRLIPALKYVDSIPQAIEAIQVATKKNSDFAADTAWKTQQDLQKEFKVATDDPEVTQMLGVQIREWLRADETRQRRYTNGDREVIREGFEHVVGKLYGPDRLAKKRDTVARARALPSVPGGRGGGAGQPGETPQINFKQAPGLVRKDVRTALRAFAGTMGREAE